MEVKMNNWNREERRSRGEQDYRQEGDGEREFNQGNYGREGNRGDYGREGYQSNYGREGYQEGSYGRGDYGQGGYYQSEGERGSYGRGDYGQGRYGESGYRRGGYGRGNFGQESYGGSRYGGQSGMNRGQGWQSGEQDWGTGQQGWGRGQQGSSQRGSGWTYTEIWLIPGPQTGRGPQGYTRSDDRIKEDVCERLTQHGQLDASGIEVQVNNGEVTLSGSVNDRQAKRMAEDTLDSVSGVKEVHNQLRVKQGGQEMQQQSGQETQKGKQKTT